MEREMCEIQKLEARVLARCNLRLPVFPIKKGFQFQHCQFLLMHLGSYYDDDFICSANDMCKESKRQTISADDVLKALDEMEFSEFVEPLRTALQGQYCYLHPVKSPC